MEKFEFRNIRFEEAQEAAEIEQICFDDNEACTEEMMLERVEKVPDLFLVAADCKTGEMAGFLNGIATNEDSFRDEFFENASLHDPDGENIMLLGLDVAPKYRGQGLARQLVSLYIDRERKKGRKALFLTCTESKVNMYRKMGFQEEGISKSVWGGHSWHEMRYGYEDEKNAKNSCGNFS